MDLVDQVQEWASYASDVVPHPPEETLTAFWIGINDTGDTVHNTTVMPFMSSSRRLPDMFAVQLDFKAFWELEMQSLFGAVVRTKPLTSAAVPLFANAGHISTPSPQQNAYDHYLRGTYLFITLPPLERSPDHIGTSIAPLYKQNIIDYNTALLKHTTRFAATHRDVNVLTFDAHAWFNEILDTAPDYGFTNITG